MNAESDPPNDLDWDDTVVLLEEGEVSLEGRLSWSSNATFLAVASLGPRVALAVYKPRSGERPLWDFPSGTLCARETAAFVVSRALGWDLVPPTVLREGPFGVGALQAYIPHDPDQHYLSLESPDPNRAMQIAIFDVVTNNADRKSGHVLVDAHGRLWAIDHGLTFGAADKLRTVIWDFAGHPVPDAWRTDLRRLAEDASETSPLRTALEPLLTPGEIERLAARAERLADDGWLPAPPPEQRDIPWPPV